MSVTKLAPSAPSPTQDSGLSIRPRRLRQSDAMRRLVRENALSPDDFIYPIFVDESLDAPVEVSSMPGAFRQSEKSLS